MPVPPDHLLTLDAYNVEYGIMKEMRLSGHAIAVKAFDCTTEWRLKGEQTTIEVNQGQLDEKSGRKPNVPSAELNNTWLNIAQPQISTGADSAG